MVRRSGVQRAADRSGHDVIALGLVFAAHILENTDVAAVDEYLVSLREDRDHVRAIVSGGALGGVIGCAGQENWRVPRSFRNYDDGVQLHSVAHGDHHFALDIVLVGGCGGEDLGNVVLADGVGWFLGRGPHRPRRHSAKRRE